MLLVDSRLNESTYDLDLTSIYSILENFNRVDFDLNS